MIDPTYDIVHVMSKTPVKSTKKTKTVKAKTKVVASKARAVKTKTSATITKNAAVKVVAAKTPKSAVKDYLNQLRLIQILSAGIFGVLAVAAGLLMNHQSYELLLGHLTRDDLASRSAAVLAPATRVLYDLELRWAVVAILVLSMILPILYLTRYKGRYAAVIKTKVNGWRWLDMAVTGALTINVVGLVSGVQDLFVLKLMSGLVVVACTLWWLAEKQNAAGTKPGRATYVVGLFSGFLPWLIIFAAAIGTYVYGMVHSPWYVYGLYSVVLLSSVLMVVNQLRAYAQDRPVYKEYAFVERNYALLNLVAKVAFAGVLIVGLLKR